MSTCSTTESMILLLFTILFDDFEFSEMTKDHGSSRCEICLDFWLQSNSILVISVPFGERFSVQSSSNLTFKKQVRKKWILMSSASNHLTPQGGSKKLLS